MIGLDIYPQIEATQNQGSSSVDERQSDLFDKQKQNKSSLDWQKNLAKLYSGMYVHTQLYNYLRYIYLLTVYPIQLSGTIYIAVFQW